MLENKRQQIVVWTALLFLLACQTTAAWAQNSNSSRVEFFQGSVINSGRVVGLGGAFVSVAEGGDGYLSNPASYANRPSLAKDEQWDWDFAYSFVESTPDDDIELQRSELGNNYTRAIRLYMGLNVFIKRHGFGIYILSQGNEFDGTPISNYPTIRYNQTNYGLGYAYGFLEGDLVLGLNIVQGLAWFQGGDKNGDFHEINNTTISEGAGFHGGALWAPCGDNHRIGVTLRTPTTAERSAIHQDDQHSPPVPDLAGLRVPNELHIPWQLAIGASRTVGPRPYNACRTFGITENRSPTKNIDRRYILFSADLVVTGASPGAIGLSSFLSGTTEPSGQSPSLSVHLGAESEAIHNLLILRGGAYYEPSRLIRTEGRLHVTGGLAVRIPLVRDWRLGVSFDWAEDYLNAGLGFGFWY